MARFFLWDGKSYGDFFITSRKINDHILSSTREGSILELHTYSVLKQTPPLIFLRSFGVVETVTYIMNTPLSLETLPKPITLLGFESYLSSISKLFDTSVPSTRKRESVSSTGYSLSLNYEDKRMYFFMVKIRNSCGPQTPPISTDIQSMHPIGLYSRFPVI